MRRVVITKIILVLLLCLTAVSLSSAQSIDLSADRSEVTLTFLKPLTALVSVEQSGDLTSWRTVDPSNEVLSETKQNAVFRSTVPADPSVRKFFFRLDVENGWKITLSWDASRSQGVTGYYLHYGFTPGDYSHTLDVGNRVQAVMSVPLTTKTCYAVVTAYNAIGFESAPSAEIKIKRKGKRSDPGRSG
jgi:hypothetical protein